VHAAIDDAIGNREHGRAVRILIGRHLVNRIDDLPTLDASRFARVFAPKVDAAFLFSQATRDRDLDVVVFFSSASALFGSPGQANYAAANAFLDAYAEVLRNEGVPATSIACGAWSGVGLAARGDHRGARLATMGLPTISPSTGFAALAQILAHPAPTVGKRRRAGTPRISRLGRLTVTQVPLPDYAPPRLACRSERRPPAGEP
jgi:NAD(P)-dependent dehydrogenase (short-subunit alcohol dehydrogenase family)